MKIDKKTGILAGARFAPSPNADERPAGCEPALIVIHGISLPPGEFGGSWIEALFCNRLDPAVHPYFAGIHAMRVSAHVLIRRDGGIIQFAPFHRRAWHAGQSCYEGRECCNDFSIGIELEGADDVAYAPAQYRRLAELVKALVAAYPSLSVERIIGHSDISPGRKTDPGPAFDWPHLHRLLRESEQ